ncbi:ROK family glucokinase [Thalassobacillus sp. C254]|uniref:ROK family glucokinase n=1 Tax=Thalassobacillus sp. C254 TaxID=1225341 RepID=UPI0006D127E2|nr:ROK family glucokinase [Thalassobacillus sp. C254]
MSRAYILGIDVGGTSIKMALFTRKGEMVKKWSIPTDNQEEGNYIVPQVKQSVVMKLEEKGLSLDNLSGTGIGVPGFLDNENERVESAVNIGWRDYPLVSILSQSLGTPVLMDNDANLAAAGEFWKGAGKGAQDVMCFTIGTGVGGGVIIDGKIVHGVGGMAGEVGHITVDPFGGKKCNCGKKGCLETISSATGMVNEALEGLMQRSNSLLHQKKGNELIAKDIFEAAAKEDELAKEVIDRSMFYLGLVIANACTLLNPKKIVIGGGVSSAGDALLDPLRSHFSRFALKKVKDDTEFVVAELGNDAGVTGAAWLALHS